MYIVTSAIFPNTYLIYLLKELGSLSVCFDVRFRAFTSIRLCVCPCGFVSVCVCPSVPVQSHIVLWPCFGPRVLSGRLKP